MLAGLLGCHIGLALAFWFGDARRFSGSGFATALDLLTRRQWAGVFVVLAVTLAAAYPHRLRMLAQLGVGMVIYLFWSACFVLSAFHSDTASVTGPIVWAVIGVAHAAVASTVYGPLPARRT